MVIGVIYIDTVCNTIRMFSHKIQKRAICGRDICIESVGSGHALTLK